VEANTPTVIALFDVLGFESRLKSIGLRRMFAAYTSLTEVANQNKSGLIIDAAPVGDGTSIPFAGGIVVQQDFFSDTFIFWVNYDPTRFRTFCRILNQFFCRLLQLGVPVRGGISVGELIMDKSKRTYLGEPLVEAARVEKAQQWVGMSLGPSFTRPPFGDHFDLQRVIFYTAHRKPGYSEYIPGLVLDWPRYWRSNIGRSPLIDLRRLDADPQYSLYYQRTFDFIEYSERNPDWYYHEV
jgi:hypothetical protein